MEINPTFKNVILDSEKLCKEKKYYQNNQQQSLSLIDIENIGGKAGILNKLLKDKTRCQASKKEEFGRLIFLAHNMLRETIFQNLYFNLIADYHQQEEEIFVENCLMRETVPPLSPTKNHKSETYNSQLETRNLQPLLQIDSHRPDRIIFQGKEIKVTTTEFSLLYLLAQHNGQVMSYDKLLDELWKDEEDSIYNRVSFHISKIRKTILKTIEESKINKEKIKDIIVVIPGRGIMLKLKAEELKIH